MSAALLVSKSTLELQQDLSNLLGDLRKSDLAVSNDFASLLSSDFSGLTSLLDSDLSDSDGLLYTLGGTLLYLTNELTSIVALSSEAAQTSLSSLYSTDVLLALCFSSTFGGNLQATNGTLEGFSLSAALLGLG